MWDLAPIAGGAGGGGGGAATTVGPVKITGYDTMADPDSKLSAASETDGALSFTVNSSTVTWDGYAEVPGWSKKITDIEGFEDFDPATWDLEVYVDYDAFPDEAGGDRFGVAVFFADQPMSGKASAHSAGFGLERVNASARAATGLGQTGIADSKLNSSVVLATRARYHYSFGVAGASMEVSGCSWHTHAGGVEHGVAPDFGASFSSDPDDLYISVCPFHRSGTDFPSTAPTIGVTLYLVGIIRPEPA